ncbi:terminase small subunit [Candidatus Dojkabacteria bacterium]|jgi:phage terminase small subunit|nr:terminase small subunit [Candidatus Dojkabacteria bacterium]
MDKRKKSLTIKERAFVRNLTNGRNITESAILAGYSNKTASSIGSQLLQKTKIIKELDDVGLSDKAIAKGLRVNFEEGLGVKATADTSLKATELILRLKGYLSKDTEATTTNNQTIYINELNNLSDNELQDRLNGLQEVVGTEVK